MPFGTLSAQLDVGSELLDWYSFATSVPHIHLLLDFSPRKDYRFHYCTNSGSNPSKFLVSDPLKQLEFSEVEHTISLYIPRVPIILPQMQKVFPSVVIKKVHQVTLRNPARHKKKSRDKILRRISFVVSK